MNAMVRTLSTTLGAVVATIGFVGYANAGCSADARAHTSWLPGDGPDGLLSAVFNPDSEGFGSAYVNGSFNASIVGLWKFTFTAKGNNPPGPPDGAPIDSGYVTWHSDGTELMNSGRAPTTGDFCMGVWQQVGPATFKLNHFAMAWEFDVDAPVTGPGTGGADFVGVANIRELVTLDRGGMGYHGSFELIQYDKDNAIAADIKGSVKGTRVTVNTRITD
jgi:hypothetical protein